MKTALRWFVAMGCAAAVVVHAAGAGAAPKKLVITTGVDTSFSQVPIGIKMGYFEKRGLEVSAKKFTSGNAGFQAFLAGEADASISASLGVVSALAQGAAIKVIGTTRAATGPYAAVVAVPEIKSPPDLLGRNVGVAWGTSGSHMYYGLFTKHYGLDRQKIKVKQLQPQEMLIAFSRGDIDALFAWPPWWRKALELRKGAHVLGMSNDNNIAIGTQTLSVSAKLARDRETVKELVRAMLEAEKYLEQNYADAVKLLAKEYNMTEELIKAELPAQTIRTELSEISFNDYRSAIEFLLENKTVKSPPDWKAVIDVEILKSVDPSRVTYKKFIE